MNVVRKRFRIEENHTPESWTGSGAGDGAAERRHREILEQIASLKGLVQPTQEMNEHVLSDYKEELRQAMALKTELDEIYEAINKTKREIATLHHSGFEGDQMLRVTDELDAIVIGTERATESILSAAEAIDERAGNVAAMVTGQAHDLTNEISDKVIGLFEACNFQDLTGQRITKVVNTLRFIEERIVRMIEIWGGIEQFAEVEVERHEKATGDKALLNGPALETDEGIASQDDIDALFS